MTTYPKTKSVEVGLNLDTSDKQSCLSFESTPNHPNMDNREDKHGVEQGWNNLDNHRQTIIFDRKKLQLQLFKEKLGLDVENFLQFLDDTMGRFKTKPREQWCEIIETIKKHGVKNRDKHDEINLRVIKLGLLELWREKSDSRSNRFPIADEWKLLLTIPSIALKLIVADGTVQAVIIDGIMNKPNFQKIRRRREKANKQPVPTPSDMLLPMPPPLSTLSSRIASMGQILFVATSNPSVVDKSFKHEFPGNNLLLGWDAGKAALFDDIHIFQNFLLATAVQSDKLKLGEGKKYDILGLQRNATSVPLVDFDTLADWVHGVIHSKSRLFKEKLIVAWYTLEERGLTRS